MILKIQEKGMLESANILKNKQWYISEVKTLVKEKQVRKKVGDAEKKEAGYN